MTCSKRILLDMDGVLTDLVSAAFRLHDIPLDRGYPMGTYDIMEAAQRIKPEFNLSPRDFWDAMDHGFWAGMLAYSGYLTIVNKAVEAVGYENVFIATSPTLAPDSASGKVEWIQNFMPWQLHRQYFITPRKYVLASKDTLLVDDSDDNCSKFKEGGGSAVLVPRPWNSRAAASAISLEVVLKEITRWSDTW